MRKIKNIQLKPRFAFALKIIGFLLCTILGIFLFYRAQINGIKKYGYSELASKNILFSKHKNYVLKVGGNKTLNAAFEGNDLKEKYLDNYTKIKYVEHEHLISNINALLDKGYSNNDINIIMSHGDDKSVSEFAKRDKIHYLEEFYSIDFAKLDYYDRYVAYSDETGEDELETVIHVNLNLDKEPYVDSTLVSNFSVDMLINKYRHLSEDFVPSDLTEVPVEYASDSDIQSSRLALNAFIEMYRAAKSEGYDIVINSGYRSYQDQVDIQQLYFNSYGQSYVDKYVAKPGYSEHQTGLAFDIGSRNSRIFADSKESGWMKDNAYKYGFILRYDERYEDLTKFRKEPWHFRYVGKEIAKYIYEHNNMSLEEYFVIFLDK